MEHAVVLGVVEGLSEFLPISSTFHLIWAATLLELPQTAFLKLFEVAIQSGAILAVLALYFDTLRRDRALVARVAVSFVPTAIVGLVLYRLIKDVFFESRLLQLAVFALVGIAFIAVERLWRGRALPREARGLSYREAVAVGLCQALAVVPGVSRAGAVMLGMMALGVRRDEAARYSFLLAVPTILAASGYDLFQTRDAIGGSTDAAFLAVGAATSFLSALLVMRWFIGYLQRHSLAVFGWYRLAAAAVLWLLFNPT